MTDFETKDSGERAVFESGMQRDTQAGKPRFDLCLPVGIAYEDQLLTRFAKLMGRGAEKYTERNWEQANSQAEVDRMRASGLRHFMQWYHGETDEDHAAAVLFNIMAAEATAHKLELERRAADLDVDPDCDVPIDGEQLISDELFDAARQWMRDNEFVAWHRPVRFIAGWDGTQDLDSSVVVVWGDPEPITEASRAESIAQMINDRLYNFQG